MNVFRPAAVMLSVSLLAACASNAPSGDSLRESVKIHMTELGYEPSVVDALSPEQIAEIENVLNTAEEPGDTQSEKKHRIDMIIGQ